MHFMKVLARGCGFATRLRPFSLTPLNTPLDTQHDLQVPKTLLTTGPGRGDLSRTKTG
jgi:hypothetical protein